MKTVQQLWNRSDWIDRTIFVSGIALALICLIAGEGSYGITVVILMGMFILVHNNRQAKTLHRLYGNLYFRMPDGEIVPRMFEMVKREYLDSDGHRYVDCPVTVCFPYCRQEDGLLYTGYGLSADTAGCEQAQELLPTLKRGEYLSVSGKIVRKSRQYFVIGELNECRRISREHVYDLDPEREYRK